jgi:hypothetical protein
VNAPNGGGTNPSNHHPHHRQPRNSTRRRCRAR